MNKQNNIKKGVLFALLTSIISGVSIFYSKISVAKIDPLTLTTSRNLFVAVAFLIFILASKKISEVKNINKKNIFSLILIGIIGGGIPFYLFFSGLQLIGSQSGNLIHKTLFIWVTLFGIAFLNENLNLTYLFSYALVLAGTFLFSPFKFVFGKGEILVLSATLFWAVENIIAKKTLHNVSSDLVGLFRMGVGSIVLLGIVFITGKQNALLSLNSSQLATVAVGATLLSLYVYFWYKALKYAPAGLVTLLLTFSVVVGNILNGGFAGVKLSQNDIYSTALIGFGTMIVFLRFLPKNPVGITHRNG